MKRLFGMFKERDSDSGMAAAPDAEPRPLPETREAWSPDGVERVAARPSAALREEKEMTSDVPASLAPAAREGAPASGLLPIEGHPLEGPIVEALKGVYDPEIPVNIYELGLIYDVKLTPENDVFVKMTLTAPGCPVAGQMPGMVRASIEEHVPDARDIDVELVWDPPWTTERMSEAAKLETGML